MAIILDFMRASASGRAEDAALLTQGKEDDDARWKIGLKADLSLEWFKNLFP